MQLVINSLKGRTDRHTRVRHMHAQTHRQIHTYTSCAQEQSLQTSQHTLTVSIKNKLKSSQKTMKFYSIL